MSGEFRPPPLPNRSSTCFAASTLQLLGSCRQLIDKLPESCTLKTLFKTPPPMDVCGCHRKGADGKPPLCATSTLSDEELKKRRDACMDHQRSVIAEFDKMMTGNNGRQEDAHEFLLVLLNYLLEKNETGDDKVVKRVIASAFKLNFGVGKTCLSCKCKSRSANESHLILTLAMSSDLQESINNFVTSVQSMRCDNCGVDGEFKFKRVIEKTYPRYALFHLARFRFWPSAMKIETPIRVQKYVFLCGRRYRLKGFVIHTGGLTSGHYISCVRVRGSKWYLCNDVFIKPISRVEMLKRLQHAYILLFSKCGRLCIGGDVKNSSTPVEDHSEPDFPSDSSWCSIPMDAVAREA